MNSLDSRPFPDLGPKTVSRLLQERLANIVIRERPVPVQWESPQSVERKEIFPCIYLEFLDLRRAEDRQFSGTIDCDFNRLSDGTYSDTVKIKHPDAYFATFSVHLYAENVSDIIDLVTEVNRRIPSFGYQFEIDGGNYRLAVQRPDPSVQADIVEEMFFHRIYNYSIESYLWDYDSVTSVPNMSEAVIEVEKVNIETEVDEN